MMRKVGFEPTRSVEHRDIYNLGMWALFEIYVHKIKGKNIRSVFSIFRLPVFHIFECPRVRIGYL